MKEFKIDEVLAVPIGMIFLAVAILMDKFLLKNSFLIS